MLLLSRFMFANVFCYVFRMIPPPTRPTTKLLLGPLSIARGQKASLIQGVIERGIYSLKYSHNRANFWLLLIKETYYDELLKAILTQLKCSKCYEILHKHSRESIFYEIVKNRKWKSLFSSYILRTVPSLRLEDFK